MKYNEIKKNNILQHTQYWKHLHFLESRNQTLSFSLSVHCLAGAAVAAGHEF